MSTPTEIYVLLGIGVAHVIERVIYYICVWLSHVSKSKCVTSVANGCIKAEAEMERETDNELQENIQNVVKQNL